jgi:hypothetical protein
MREGNAKRARTEQDGQGALAVLLAAGANSSPDRKTTKTLTR